MNFDVAFALATLPYILSGLWTTIWVAIAGSLGASLLGLPLSTTHVAVGGVFGVGFYREWRDRRLAASHAPLPAEERRRRHLVRRSYMRMILGAWLVTVPATAALAAALVWIGGF